MDVVVLLLCVVLVVVVVIPPPSALFAAETDVNTVCREETRELIRSLGITFSTTARTSGE